MSNGIKTGVISVLLIALLWILASFYIVPEGYSALLLKLGQLARDVDGKVKTFGPGLHYKTPIFNNARIFDTRLQTLDIKSSRIVTQEKKDVIVDYYIKWRISDLGQYYKSTSGNAYNAETLLEQFLNASIRAEFGKRTIPDVVSGERDNVMDILQKKANKSAVDLGIEVIDVRIKGVDFPSTSSNAVYKRMRTNMEKIANRYRADGMGEAEAIRAQADKEVAVTLATARSQGEKIRAAGAAKAEKIYAEAYGKDAEFFAFYRSLKAYETAFNNKHDVLVLNQDGQFFDYFGQSTGLKRDPKSKN